MYHIHMQTPVTSFGIHMGVFVTHVIVAPGYRMFGIHLGVPQTATIPDLSAAWPVPLHMCSFHQHMVRYARVCLDHRAPSPRTQLVTLDVYPTTIRHDFASLDGHPRVADSDVSTGVGDPDVVYTSPQRVQTVTTNPPRLLTGTLYVHSVNGRASDGICHASRSY